MEETGQQELKPYAEIYAGAKATADSILAGINEYFDYPFTILMCLTFGYIGYNLWVQGHWFWSLTFIATTISQAIRISLRFIVRWKMKREAKKSIKALEDLDKLL